MDKVEVESKIKAAKKAAEVLLLMSCWKQSCAQPCSMGRGTDYFRPATQ